MDGWSVVGSNIVNNLTECSIQVFSSEERNKTGFGLKRLKSQRPGRFIILSILFDLINVLLTSKIKPDIIHCNVEHYAPVAMILSAIYHIPYTITAHGTYGVLLPTKYKIYRKAFRNASKVITVSKLTKNRMIQNGIVANYETILLGVDKTVFKPDYSTKKENIITFVGNLKPRKGLLFLLESMVIVKTDRPDIKVVVIGGINFNDKKYQKIEKFISENRLNVEFIGKISESELVECYQKSTLNALLSQTVGFHFEGFGLIHLEANACGTLTIGTLNSGNEDAIIDKNGFLIEYGDVNQLSKIILEVFSYDKYPVIDINKINDWSYVAKKYFSIFKELS
jgi:glycosyltransferase involved in cell wall biosynthesis